MDNIVKVPIKEYYAGGYRLEYDGKYITLFGKEKTYPGFKFYEDDEDWFEEMVLISCVAEIRHASPEIIEVTDKEIIIKLK
jgi:hypothetical protein